MTDLNKQLEEQIKFAASRPGAGHRRHCIKTLIHQRELAILEEVADVGFRNFKAAYTSDLHEDISQAQYTSKALYERIATLKQEEEK